MKNLPIVAMVIVLIISASFASTANASKGATRAKEIRDEVSSDAAAKMVHISPKVFRIAEELGTSRALAKKLGLRSKLNSVQKFWIATPLGFRKMLKDGYFNNPYPLLITWDGKVYICEDEYNYSQCDSNEIHLLGEWTNF